MPRRAATVARADIARAIRAIQATGLPVHRIVVRLDGVSVETDSLKGSGKRAWKGCPTPVRFTLSGERRVAAA